MYSECCLFKFAISLYVFPVLLLPFTAPEIFYFFTWCFFFQSWVVLLKLHNILYSCDFIYYTHILKVFFFSYSVVCANTAVLYTQVCEHSSSFHAAKCSSVTLIVLTFIITSDAWLMLLCTTLYPLNASEATSFAYGVFFFFIQWRDGGGERAVFQHVLVIWAHAKHWHHVSIFRVVALTWFSHSELCLTSNINTW